MCHSHLRLVIYSNTKLSVTIWRRRDPALIFFRGVTVIVIYISDHTDKMASSNQTSSDCRKLALIIGNDNYARPQNRLNHSISNARELNGLLRTINFDVTMHTDVATDIMVTIKDFATKIKDGDLILVYFSGHSCQVNGKNYLIPVPGDQIEADIDIEVTANDVERILDRLLEKKPYVTILILDCCRPYLLKGESTTNCK
jgi:hypothetical protein